MTGELTVLTGEPRALTGELTVLPTQLAADWNVAAACVTARRRKAPDLHHAEEPLAVADSVAAYDPHPALLAELHVEAYHAAGMSATGRRHSEAVLHPCEESPAAAGSAVANDPRQALLGELLAALLAASSAAGSHATSPRHWEPPVRRPGELPEAASLVAANDPSRE